MANKKTLEDTVIDCVLKEAPETLQDMNRARLDIDVENYGIYAVVETLHEIIDEHKELASNENDEEARKTLTKISEILNKTCDALRPLKSFRDKR